MTWLPRNISEEIEQRAKERETDPTPLNEEALAIRDLLVDSGDLSVLSEDDNSHELISIDVAAELLGVTKQTLRNWDKEGKLVPASRTGGGHRRYLRSQINVVRKAQIGNDEILLHDITASKLRDIVEKLLANFKPEESINLTIKTDTLDRKVRLSLDSADGFCSVTKTFNMED